jgi:hypothetical protein
MKRAEAAAIKRRFDVPFGLPVDVDAGIDPEYAGDWVVEGEVVGESETVEQNDGPPAMPCTCGHTLEEHGIKMNCEANGCNCKRYTDPRLARGKKVLGRDAGGID